MLSSVKCPNVLQVTSRDGMLQRLKESEVYDCKLAYI
jgi:hypothetical protein